MRFVAAVSQTPGCREPGGDFDPPGRLNDGDAWRLGDLVALGRAVYRVNPEEKSRAPGASPERKAQKLG